MESCFKRVNQVKQKLRNTNTNRCIYPCGGDWRGYWVYKILKYSILLLMAMPSCVSQLMIILVDLNQITLCYNLVKLLKSLRLAPHPIRAVLSPTLSADSAHSQTIYGTISLGNQVQISLLLS